MNKKTNATTMLFSLFVALFTTFGYSQVPDLVATDGITNALHKNNVGKIFFTDKRIPTAELQQHDFLHSYTLTPKSNLFFVAYFDNSLTNYKHQLAPTIALDSLYSAGNFQFTLFVDGKEIYRSNLMPGAPQAQIQNSATLLNRPLIDNIDGQGSWSESFWNRFLSNGGENVLTDGNHTLRMEIRPYIKSDQEKVGELMASGELIIEVAKHPKIDITKINLNKPTAYNGISVSKDAFDTNKIKELKGAIEEGAFKKINGIVVLKNGKLLIEEYFNGSDRSTLHDPRSVGKSFASTLMGMAIADGFIKDENQPLKSFYAMNSFQHFSKEKENITIRELLSMSSGLDGDDADGNSAGNEENMYPTEDWVRFTLDLPFRNDFKNNWHYFTAGVVVLGDILNKSVAGGLDQYAKKRLFEPLQITNYAWQYTPQNVPNTAGGIRMNALDFAKFGQLYKNNGTWNGKQLLSKDWVAKSFSKQQQIIDRDNEYYGFLFWNKSFAVHNKNYEAYYCAGNGGNYILVFKDQPLLIVITASAYGQQYAHSQVQKIIAEFLLPAVVK